MTFTSLPEMFSSVFGPLAYTFSNAAETELFLEILSTRDGSRIGSNSGHSYVIVSGLFLPLI